MCAYNRFNDTSSCHNAGLIGPNGLLRKNGFKGGCFSVVCGSGGPLNFSWNEGYVVSDWGATHDSAADNANAGLDMEQPGDFILIGESLCC